MDPLRITATVKKTLGYDTYSLSVEFWKDNTAMSEAFRLVENALDAYLANNPAIEEDRIKLTSRSVYNGRIMKAV